jgi:inner membrane transporter RhtA
MRRIGRLFSEQDGLCLSLTVAALLALPISFLLEPGGKWLSLLPAVPGLALLSPLIPFVLEMMALRRMEVGAFSILVTLEPALGVLFGFAILQQNLTLQQITGVAAVMIASCDRRPAARPECPAPCCSPRRVAIISPCIIWHPLAAPFQHRSQVEP